MRPYYLDGVREKLKKLSPANRRKVIAHARAEGTRLAHPLDVQGNYFAVMPHHLVECGFTGPRSSEKKTRVEAFISHMQASNGRRRFPLKTMTRAYVLRAMKMPDTYTYAAWLNFKAGWDAYASA